MAPAPSIPASGHAQALEGRTVAHDTFSLSILPVSRCEILQSAREILQLPPCQGAGDQQARILFHSRRLAQKIDHPLVFAHSIEITCQLPGDFEIVRMFGQITFQRRPRLHPSSDRERKAPPRGR